MKNPELRNVTNWSRWGIALLCALLLVTRPSLAYGAALGDTEVVTIRIEVTDAGFKPNEIDVPQGKEVALTFVWAHEAFPNEEHIIVLEGYRLESDKIDQHNRETTITFIADKPGTFLYKCDIDCDLHDFLQAGRVKVTRVGDGAGGAATVRPTKLTLSPATWVTTGEPVRIMAVLTDLQGAPVVKAPVVLSVDAQFINTNGQMVVATARTDANGVAFLEYQPTLAVQRHILTGRFAGRGVYDESEQTIAVEQLMVLPRPARPMTIGFESLRQAGPTALAIVIISVWSAFAYVLFQAIRIAWLRPRR